MPGLALLRDRTQVQSSPSDTGMPFSSANYYAPPVPLSLLRDRTQVQSCAAMLCIYVINTYVMYLCN